MKGVRIGLCLKHSKKSASNFDGYKGFAAKSVLNFVAGKVNPGKTEPEAA